MNISFLRRIEHGKQFTELLVIVAFYVYKHFSFPLPSLYVFFNMMLIITIIIHINFKLYELDGFFYCSTCNLLLQSVKLIIRVYRSRVILFAVSYKCFVITLDDCKYFIEISPILKTITLNIVYYTTTYPVLF